MKTKDLAGAALIGLTVTLAAHAQTLDFEDLVAGTVYVVDDVIVTNGAALEVHWFDEVTVATVGNAGGSGNELFLSGAVGLRFSLPGSPTALTMKIGIYDSVGVFRTSYFDSTTSPTVSFGSLAELDGSSMGDIDFAVLSSQAVAGGEIGVLRMTGPVSTFDYSSRTPIGSGGGTYFDDIVIVPEPASIAILPLLLSCLSLRRRHR